MTTNLVDYDELLRRAYAATKDGASHVLVAAEPDTRIVVVARGGRRPRDTDDPARGGYAITEFELVRTHQDKRIAFFSYRRGPLASTLWKRDA